MRPRHRRVISNFQSSWWHPHMHNTALGLCPRTTPKFFILVQGRHWLSTQQLQKDWEQLHGGGMILNSSVSDSSWTYHVSFVQRLQTMTALLSTISWSMILVSWKMYHPHSTFYTGTAISFILPDLKRPVSMHPVLSPLLAQPRD